MITVTGMLSDHRVVAIKDGARIRGDHILLCLARLDIAEGLMLSPHPLVTTCRASFDDEDSFATTIIESLDTENWRVDWTRRWPPLRVMCDQTREHHRRRIGRELITITGRLNDQAVVAVIAHDRIWGDPDLVAASSGDPAGLRDEYLDDRPYSAILKLRSGQALWRKWQVEHVIDPRSRTVAETTWLPPLSVLSAAADQRLWFWPGSWLMRTYANCRSLGWWVRHSDYRQVANWRGQDKRTQPSRTGRRRSSRR